MEEKKKICLCLVMGIMISFGISLFFVFTIFRMDFKEADLQSTIQIIDTAKKNSKSGGTDVRLKSVKVNGENIPFSELDYGSEWVEMDGLLIAINPQTPTYIEYTGNNIEQIEIEFQKHDGSGIVAISDNGKNIEKIDLYDSGWSSAHFVGSLGHISVLTHPLYFGILWLSLALIVFLVVRKKQYKKRGWIDCGILSCLIILFILGQRLDDEFGRRSVGWFIIGIGLLWEVLNIVVSMLKKESKLQQVLTQCILVLFIAALSWMQLEIGCDYTSEFEFLKIEIQYILLNILTIVVVINVLNFFLNRWWLSTFISSSIFYIISVANYYVIQFHSMPLSVNEMRNFGTALGVVGSYKFAINRYIVFMTIFYLIGLAGVYLLKKTEQNSQYSWHQIIIKNVVICVLSLAILYKGYWAEEAIKSAKNIEYAWQDTFHQYGYIACSIDLIRQAVEVIQEPEGYTEERVDELAENLKEIETIPAVQNPDIILILNETFFDLRQVADIETDQPFLSNWDNLTNAVRGYAVAPLVGGGTNCSEYEVLTGNSLQLMPGITPFYVLDLEEANGIASGLLDLGYSTMAAHSEHANSYNRFQSYPKLGFQSTKFDGEFKDKEYYGDRQYYETDESLYKNLIQWYNEMPENSPRFLYLLTIQNHGDWNINESKEDLIHVKNDFGDATDLVNEYLSCIKKSDDALKQLTEYFETVDRPVIVCMVGDHSPYLASTIIDPEHSAVEKDIRLRGTPFVIWSNFDMENRDLGYISMNYLPSTILEVAGITSSPYYQYMQEMRKTLPIVSSYGKYYDLDKNEYDYEDETIYTSMINDYFYLEYNNLNRSKRKQELFEP